MKTRDRLQTTSLVAAFVAAMLQLASESAWAYYNPHVGRWLNRDPIGESGGENLYCAVANRLVNKVDLFGLCPSASCLGSSRLSLNAAGNLPSRVDSPASARALCQSTIDQVNSEGGPQILPPDKAPKCANQCNAKVRALENDIGMKGWFDKFGKDCPRPPIECQPCKGADGWYENNPPKIVICHKEGDWIGLPEFRNTLTHELIHALQACYAKETKGCLASLKRELEAYYCSTGAYIPEELMASAVQSSCGTKPSKCTPQEVENLHAEVLSWLNKEKDNLCNFPRKPEFPAPR